MINFDFGCILKPVTSHELETMRQWRNKPEIYNWCRQSDLISDYQQQKWFESIQNDPKIKMFIISIGMIDVGVCGLTSIDPVARRAEFSLYIGPEHQGKGYAPKALKTLFKAGYDQFNLNLIWGETFDGNPAINLFESIGMQYEGTRRQFYFKNGKYLDAHIYSLTHTEYKEQPWSTSSLQPSYHSL